MFSALIRFLQYFRGLKQGVVCMIPPLHLSPPPHHTLLPVGVREDGEDTEAAAD